MKDVFNNNDVSILYISNSSTIILKIWGFNPSYRYSVSYCNAIASAMQSGKYTGSKANIIIKFASIIKNDINDKFSDTTANMIINLLCQKLYLATYYVDLTNDIYNPRKYSFGFMHNNDSYTVEIFIGVNNIEVIIMRI